MLPIDVPDDEDTFSALPVTSAASVVCGPRSELAPYIRRAQEILDLRDADPGSRSRLSIRFATEVVALSGALIR